MKLEVNIKKKYFFTILASVLILVAIIGTVAYGTNNPSVFGHSAGEVEVTIGGNNYTLQEAITQNLIGGGGGGSIATRFCTDVQSDSASSSKIAECVSAAANGGAGDGAWRAISCRRDRTDGLQNAATSGVFIEYTSAKRWRVQWPSASEFCIDGSTLIIKVGGSGEDLSFYRRLMPGNTGNVISDDLGTHRHCTINSFDFATANGNANTACSVTPAPISDQFYPSNGNTGIAGSASAGSGFETYTLNAGSSVQWTLKSKTWGESWGYCEAICIG